MPCHTIGITKEMAERNAPSIAGNTQPRKVNGKFLLHRRNIGINSKVIYCYYSSLILKK